MADSTPIVFYDLVAQKGTHAPFFSPATIRALLAFALKGIPVETVEVSGHRPSPPTDGREQRS